VKQHSTTQGSPNAIHLKKEGKEGGKERAMANAGYSKDVIHNHNSRKRRGKEKANKKNICQSFQ